MVRKFCRKYQEEVQRPRAEIEADTATEQPLAPLTVQANKTRPLLTSVIPANVDRAPRAMNCNHGQP
jgi:hypothetical protein